jgi:4-amino-4-deoxy-L-arabinose transferase-like glycosyltransferase
VPGFRQSSPLIWILGLALALRVAAAFAVDAYLKREPGRDFLIAGDASGYWELGREIAAGEEYALYDPPRRVMRMPGFPLLLALSGGSLLAARLMLAVIGTAACWLVYRLGREWIDETTGLVAAGITAVSPTLVGFSVLILTETTFAAAMTLSLLLMTWLVRDRARIPGISENPWDLRGRRLFLAFLAGAAVSLACYVRPSWLLFGPAFVAYRLFCRRGKTPGMFRNRWGLALEAAAILLGMVVLLAPWAIRNYRVTNGRFVVTTLWVGPSLYDGLNPEATGDSNMAFFERDHVLDRMSEYEMDRHYRRKAWEFVADNPGRTAELAAWKLARYWRPWPNADQFQRPWMVVTATACWIFVFGPALAGLWLMRKRFLVLLVTAGPVLYFAAIHCVFVGSIRYRLPAEYPLAVLAAVGWVAGRRHFRKIPVES